MTEIDDILSNILNGVPEPLAVGDIRLYWRESIVRVLAIGKQEFYRRLPDCIRFEVIGLRRADFFHVRSWGTEPRETLWADKLYLEMHRYDGCGVLFGTAKAEEAMSIDADWRAVVSAKQLAKKDFASYDYRPHVAAEEAVEKRMNALLDQPAV